MNEEDNNGEDKEKQIPGSSSQERNGRSGSMGDSTNMNKIEERKEPRLNNDNFEIVNLDYEMPMCSLSRGM